MTLPPCDSSSSHPQPGCTSVSVLHVGPPPGPWRRGGLLPRSSEFRPSGMVPISPATARPSGRGRTGRRTGRRTCVRGSRGTSPPPVCGVGSIQRREWSRCGVYGFRRPLGPHRAPGDSTRFGSVPEGLWGSPSPDLGSGSTAGTVRTDRDGPPTRGEEREIPDGRPEIRPLAPRFLPGALSI